MSIGALPYQLPTNAGWQYLQTSRDSLTTPVAANGVCEVDLAQVPPGQQWRITRMAVSCTLGGPSFTAYFNSVAPSFVADSTARGAGDVDDAAEPIVLSETDVLLLVWSGCPDGAVGSACIQRDVYQRVT